MAKYIADTGINWIVVYEVVYEDEEILILRECGRFHKYDDDRQFKGEIAAWIDSMDDTYCRVEGKLRLVEIQQE